MSDNKVYTRLKDLVGLQFAKKHARLSPNVVSKSDRIGQHCSLFRGQGVDFLESRIYESGDDVRRIDWGVTARTGKLHTKIFTQDHEVPFCVVLDQSMSMYFGSRFCFKSVQAARLAAMISWRCVGMGNRLGGVVFGQKGCRFFKPSLRRVKLLQWLSAIDHFNHQLSIDCLAEHPSSQLLVKQALEEALQLTRVGHYQIYFISDGFGFTPTLFDVLAQLSARHHVSVLRVYDPLEAGQAQSHTGRVVATDGQTDTLLNFNVSYLSTIQAQFKANEDRLVKQFNQSRIHYQLIGTDQAIETLF